MSNRLSRDSAFSLVEITLALGVVGIALVAIFGLLPTGLGARYAASQETVAGNFMTAMVTDVHSTPTGINSSVIYHIPLTGNGTFYLSDDGAATTSLKASSQFLCTITSLPAPGNTATCLRISLTWPAAVDPNVGHPQGKLETYVAVNR